MRLRAGGVATGAALVLVLAVAAVPGSLWATAAFSEPAASFGLEPELHRLQTIREQLSRRRALRASLEARAAALGAEVEALARQREQTATALQDQRADVAMIERRLDHLVPRALAHDAAMRARREEVGRLLGGLASSSRRVELDQTIRARLLAIGPVMLRRLRGAEARLASLEQQPEAALDRQDAIERRVALLMAEAQRLQREDEERVRQREATRTRLGGLSVEMAWLEDDQRVLSQRLLTTEAAHVARAGPRADEPALPGPLVQPEVSDVMVGAAVKGQLPARFGAGFAANARQPATPQLIAVAAGRPPSLTTVRLDLPAMSPPPAKPFDVALKGDVRAAARPLGDDPGGTALDMVFLEPAPLADVGSRVATARLRRAQPPLVPVPGEMVNPFSDQAGASAGSDLMIAAAPGQPVAAPEAGRVVFAGMFRSYGNLLIIEHQREYHTLLWGLSEFDVAKGDQVRTGQVVGVMPDEAGSRPQLHVELRHNGRPVNPLPWLAASSNKVRG